MSELRPCPFCGQEAEIYENKRHEYYPECTNCGMGLSAFGCDDYKDAVELWNTRYDDWQPIETAPKDGVWILAYYEEGDTVERVQWSPTPKGNFPWCSHLYVRFTEDAFTQWMPLPLPSLNSIKESG